MTGGNVPGNDLKALAPWVGLEPTAYGLTVRRSTIELPGSKSQTAGV